jgi:hypothetical protein
LILYLKFKFPVFLNIDRRTLEYFVRRLAFALYKPTENVAKRGDKCTGMIMIIDGEVEARSKDQQSDWFRQQSLMEENQTETERGFIKTFAAGTSYGEQCFDSEHTFPFHLVCTKRCLTLTLSKKDFAEVLYYQRMTERAEWQAMLMKIPFVKAMPYHLSQDMSSLLYE